MDDGEQQNEKHLPERPRNTVLPGHVRTLKEGGSPSPLTDDDRGREARFDTSSCRAVE